MPNKIGENEGITLGDWIAFGIGGLWLLGCAVFFWFLPIEGGIGPLRGLMMGLAAVLPLSMIWLGVLTGRALRQTQDENRRLQMAVDNLRKEAKTPPKQSPVRPKTPEPTAPKQTPPPEPAQVEQPALALEPQRDVPPPLAANEFISALNFPSSADDMAGIAAMRKALKHRQIAGVIQASQDLLTLLAQDGIYVDDLTPDRARPEIWRRFAAGERGASVGAVGGVRDADILAVTTGRMREDTIFRDTAHHFLRRFDRLLVAFEPTASDADLIALSDTRTARAFMLLSRVSGTFD